MHGASGLSLEARCSEATRRSPFSLVHIDFSGHGLHIRSWKSFTVRMHRALVRVEMICRSARVADVSLTAPQQGRVRCVTRPAVPASLHRLQAFWWVFSSANGHACETSLGKCRAGSLDSTLQQKELRKHTASVLPLHSHPCQASMCLHDVICLRPL
jgi:hypothetical protein